MHEPFYRLPFEPTAHIVRRPAPFHHGKAMRHCIDWEMPPGTRVLAAHEGMVIECVDTYWRTHTDPRFHRRVNRIVIRHFGGEETTYVHLQYRSARVRVGERVFTGQCIALSGQTGYATYPHLHFGIYDATGNSMPVRRLMVPELIQVFAIHRHR